MNSFVSKWNGSWLASGKNVVRILSNNSALPHRHPMAGGLSRTIATTSCCNVMSVYKISLKTGKMAGAGTDANVYIRMIGELGSTEEMKLKTKVDDMERGMTDTYSVPSEDVGVLKKLIVRHDNTGFGAAWFLEWVKIKDGRGKNYHFKCEEWLDTESSTTGPIKLLRESNYVDSDPSHARKHAETIKSSKITDHLVSNKTANVVITDTVVSSDEVAADAEEILEVIPEGVGEELVAETDSVASSSLESTEGDGESSNESTQSSTRHSTSLSPAVRYILETYGIDMAVVPATGRFSRILKGDVLAYISRENPAKKDFSQTPPPDTSNAVKVEPVVPPIPLTTGVQSREELSSIVGDHYLDRQLSEGYQNLAEALKTGNFEVPLLHMSTTCTVDKLEPFTQTIIADDPSVTRSAVITRILCRALHETEGFSSNNEKIDVLLNHDGNPVALRDCGVAGIGSLIGQYNANKDQTEMSSIPHYGVNIIDMDGVSQLSSVLRMGQLLCLNVGGVRLGINTEGQLTQCLTLSVSCDNRIISEESCALFLSNFKNYLSDPYLLQL